MPLRLTRILPPIPALALVCRGLARCRSARNLHRFALTLILPPAVALAAMLAGATPAYAQTPPANSAAAPAPPAQPQPPPELKAELARLARISDDLEHRLPDFACTESLVSQALRGGKVRAQVAATGNLRVQQAPDGKFNEHLEVVTVDGRPATQLKAPMFVSGGFENALNLFQSAAQPCFTFTASPGRIDFANAASDTAACQSHLATTGYVLLDADGNPTHLETHHPLDVARAHNAVPNGVINLTRTALGGSTFYLSTHVVADIPEDKFTYHWEANYSNCRLFTVTVKIAPVTTQP